MKLIIGKTDDGAVVSVQTFERYLNKKKTEEEILEAVKKENDRRGYEYYVIEEVSDILSEACSFMLGEKQYKVTYDIECIIDRIEELRDYVDAVDDEVSDILNSIDDIKGKVKDLVKEDEA